VFVTDSPQERTVDDRSEITKGESNWEKRERTRGARRSRTDSRAARV